MSCYKCKHLQVCKYFKWMESGFQFKSDNHIGDFCLSLAATYAKACKHYDQKEEESK